MPKILLENRPESMSLQDQKGREKTCSSSAQQRLLKELRILQVQRRVLEELFPPKPKKVEREK